MTRAITIYSTEDIDVTFSADLVRSDYGVPGSPVWYEPENIEIEEIVIMGVAVKEKYLPVDLTYKILELADEIDDWETNDS